MSHPHITTRRSIIRSILISLFLLFNFTEADDPVYMNHTCTDQPDNTTHGFSRDNLISLMNSLSNVAANKSYYSESSGGIYSLFLCRGDIPQKICQICIRMAVQNITGHLCPANTTGNGAIIWYDLCMLRYSDTNFIGIKQSAPTAVSLNATIETSPTYYGAVVSLMHHLALKAPGKAVKFSTGQSVADGGHQMTMYGLVQCSRDMYLVSCNKCLMDLTKEMHNFCKGRRGWTILAPSCSMRYEEYQFYYTHFFEISPPSAKHLEKNQDKESSWVRIVVPASTTVVAASILSLSLFLSCRWWRKRAKQKSKCISPFQNKSLCKLEPEEEQRSSHEDSEEVHFFDFPTIVNSINNFSLSNKLGEGGFGPVYRGKLHDGKEIAVKRLSKISKQGLEEFRTEVALIAKLQHTNLVRVLGSCTGKQEKLLIYEYVANKSLDTFLFDDEKRKHLDWTKRANIVHGITKGVQYLHEESCLKIIHRDLKASNVLLDEKMNPKISDFGTARMFHGEQIEGKTKRVVGTYGYIAPEYAMKGLFSAKSDVYSFGVLMLEIISGIRNTATSLALPDCQQGLLSHAWSLWSEGRGKELIDPNVVDHCPISEVLRWIHIALQCVQEDPASRPTMSSVVLMLESKSIEMRRPYPPPFSSSSKSGVSDTVDEDHLLRASDMARWSSVKNY